MYSTHDDAFYKNKIKWCIEKLDQTCIPPYMFILINIVTYTVHVFGIYSQMNNSKNIIDRHVYMYLHVHVSNSWRIENQS